ncbi:MAG: HAMP domain-containing histidine kinase [Lachnospiraceae bacterium]|nr:HAMP domain-containing histidine kinase [Candidatus Equihabitans merdae]
MKLRARFILSFLLMIILPMSMVSMIITAMRSVLAKEFETRYGINMVDPAPETRSIMTTIVVLFMIVMIVTAGILTVWLTRSISTPIYKMTKAMDSIRDGNMECAITPEGDVELRELGEAFEEMRQRLKTAAEESERYDQQNRELISNISHDLKTPITAVKGYVEGIMDGVADTPEKMERYIHTIYNKTNEMDHLINELTFYSKIDTNRIPYNFSKLNVRAFFGDAAEELQLETEQRQVAFSYECKVEDNTEIIADAEQINRVIHNIVNNSLKYMDKEEKELSLKVTVVGDEVHAAITDNGKGIGAKDIGHIFDRFYRTDSSRHSAQGGSGIGLSIVRKIMEDHGGRVWCASKEGQGTTMYLAFRKYEAETN